MPENSHITQTIAQHQVFPDPQIIQIIFGEFLNPLQAIDQRVSVDVEAGYPTIVSVNSSNQSALRP